MAVVSQTRSAITTGDDRPRPGIVTFQAMLLLSLQVRGTLRAVELPSPCGPRNCGQSWSAPA